MFDFAKETKEMTAAEILNYYRNLYYAEPQVTERGIMANAINDFFSEFYAHIRNTAQKKQYKGHTYYLYDGQIYNDNMEIIINKAENGFLDLFEYYEYFPQQ